MNSGNTKTIVHHNNTNVSLLTTTKNPEEYGDSKRGMEKPWAYKEYVL